MSAIELSGITKSWKDKIVLREIDLQIAPGELVWVGGNNGAGKTTLLRIAAGILEPSAGKVLIAGLSPAERVPFQQAIGYLASGDRGLYARLSVRHNLRLWSRLSFLPAEARQSRIDEWIERMRLTELVDARADRISTGQRQRVRLAMAFMHRPRALLLDEAAANLDDEGVEGIREALDEFRSDGAAVLWSSPRAPTEVGVDRGYSIDQGTLEPA